MCDFSDSERGQIVHVRLAEASATKTNKLFNLSPTTVFTVMTTYTKHGKQKLSMKRSSGRKPKLINMDRPTLKMMLTGPYKRTKAEVTTEHNIHVSNTVSIKAPQSELYKLTSMERLQLQNLS